MSDIVERLRDDAACKSQVAWSRSDGGFEHHLAAGLANEAADEIDRLRRELEEANKARDDADFALVDKYRDPKTGHFLFPTDVARIIQKLERERDEIRHLTIEDVADWYADKGWKMDEDDIAAAIRALKETSNDPT